MRAEPLIGLICDHTSPILAGYIQRSGYRILQVAPDQLVEGEMPVVDVWVVDCADTNAIADATLWLEPRILALSNRPAPEHYQDYRVWCERIITTLEKWTGHLRHGEAAPTLSTPAAFSRVQGVWLLAGSTGAFGAVSRFLATLREPPPVAFLYAQHIDPRQESSLAAINMANRNIQCTLALGRHWLNPGQLLIVPASSQLRFGRQGEVFSTRQAWDTPESPSINNVMLAMAGMSPTPAGVIVFSGAGEDGSTGVRALAQRGSRIWAQRPETSEAPSMPRAIINTGIASYTASPEALAVQLRSLY
ncbi:MAG: chemotaxis protein CheB [Halieaceae bacterium]|jgi:chemosensory pili system protein ChpB (putative protein-glutamate methylesterase)|nr:chemotaxis protein CheB [Halieaceae bacterium]